MPVAKPFYSVIVPTYNRGGRIIEALYALTNQTVSAEQYEIVIVDDESTDATEKVVKDYSTERRVSNIHYNRIPHGGPAAARNAGISLARGEILFFTDDDCLVPPNWVETLAGGYRRHPKTVGVGGWYIRDPLTLATNKVAQFAQIYEQWLHDRTVMLVTNHTEVFGVGAPAGNTANMSYKRSLFDTIGGFDEAIYFPGQVDWEFRTRVIVNNFPTVYLPFFVLHHKSTDVQVFLRKHFMAGRGNRYIQEKYFDLTKMKGGSEVMYPMYRSITGPILRSFSLSSREFKDLLPLCSLYYRLGGPSLVGLLLLHKLARQAGWWYGGLRPLHSSILTRRERGIS